MERTCREELNRIYHSNQPLSNYAFSLFLYIQRLHKKCICDGITDLFFLSREGRFLKRLYERYDELAATKCPARTHYLYVSRKSVTAAAWESLEIERFDALRVYGRMSAAKFLSCVGFCDAEISGFSDLLHGEMNVEQSDFWNSAAFETLKRDPEFSAAYDAKRARAYCRLRTYLEKSGFSSAQKAAVADVGWNGTIQDYLFKMEPHRALYGYYIGISKIAHSDTGNIKNGLLFYPQSPEGVFQYDNHHYEYICVADHGATVGYDSQGAPILEWDRDCELYENAFEKIQDGIAAKFCAIHRVIAAVGDGSGFEEYVMACHAKMLLHFTKAEKQILRDSQNRHPDNLAEIKAAKSAKYYAWQIKRRIYLSGSAVKYALPR